MWMLVTGTSAWEPGRIAILQFEEILLELGKLPVPIRLVLLTMKGGRTSTYP